MWGGGGGGGQWIKVAKYNSAFWHTKIVNLQIYRLEHAGISTNSLFWVATRTGSFILYSKDPRVVQSGHLHVNTEMHAKLQFSRYFAGAQLLKRLAFEDEYKICLQAHEVLEVQPSFQFHDISWN